MAIDKIVKEISLDISGEIKKFAAIAKQGDKATRFIAVKLLKEGIEWQIPEGEIYIANMKKPDGKICFNLCQKERNRILLELTNQALAAEGILKIDLQVRSRDDAQIITSGTFEIQVEQSMFNENAIESSNELGVIDEKLREVEKQEKLRQANEEKRIEQESEREKTSNIVILDAVEATEETREAATAAIEAVIEANAATERSLETTEAARIEIDEAIAATGEANMAAAAANAAADRASAAAESCENIAEGAIPSCEKGIAGGVATLDENEKVTEKQIPDYIAKLKDVSALAAEVNELKKNVSDGKGNIAAAVTRKKVATAAGDSFDTMAGNIDKIRLGSGNATPDKVLQGATFTNDLGVEQAGAMANKSGTTQWWSGYETISVQPVESDPGGQAAVTVPNRHGAAGYYSSSSSVFGYVAHLSAGNIKHNVLVGRMGGDSSNCIKGTFTSDANTDTSLVLQGQPYYCLGEKRYGTMPNRGYSQSASLTEISMDKSRLYSRMPYGYYQKEGNADPYVAASISSVATCIGLTADKIVTGQTVCGITGNGTIYEKCFRYCYLYKDSNFYWTKELWTVKAGATITIPWSYLYNGIGGWTHSTSQDWNNDVDPGFIAYSYSNSAKTYTVTGVAAGISIIRVRSQNNTFARCMIIVEG